MTFFFSFAAQAAQLDPIDDPSPISQDLKQEISVPLSGIKGVSVDAAAGDVCVSSTHTHTHTHTHKLTKKRITR